MQWSRNPFFIIGSLYLELNSLPNFSGIHSKVVVAITLLRVDFTVESGFHYFECGFPLQN